MARFDIYANPGRNRVGIPYLVDVQNNVISGLATRIVVPLRILGTFAAVDLPADLCPMIPVDGVDHFLDTAQLGVIPASELKALIGSARDHHFAIQAALDRALGAY